MWEVQTWEMLGTWAGVVVGGWFIWNQNRILNKQNQILSKQTDLMENQKQLNEILIKRELATMDRDEVDWIITEMLTADNVSETTIRPHMEKLVQKDLSFRRIIRTAKRLQQEGHVKGIPSQLLSGSFTRLSALASLRQANEIDAVPVESLR